MKIKLLVCNVLVLKMKNFLKIQNIIRTFINEERECQKEFELVKKRKTELTVLT